MIADKLPFKFRFNNRADETFTKHMYSEALNPKSGRFEPHTKDTPNHLWDCMCMTLVLALMSKCYIPDATITETEVVAKAREQIAASKQEQPETSNAKQTTV